MFTSSDVPVCGEGGISPLLECAPNPPTSGPEGPDNPNYDYDTFTSNCDPWMMQEPMSDVCALIL